MSESIALAQYADIGGRRIGGKPFTYTSGSLKSISELIPNSADVLVAFVLDVTQVQSLIIVAAADMTLEWNDNAGTQGSLILVANKVIAWDTDYPTIHPNPLGAVDFTALYVTNASGAAALLDIRVIFDPTV